MEEKPIQVEYSPRPDQRTMLLYAALAAALLSTVLFVAGEVRIGLGYAAGIPTRWLYAAAHLLGAFGTGVLLWAFVRKYETESEIHNYALYAATFAAVAYHLSASVGYVLAFGPDIYLLTMILWWMRMLLSPTFIVESLYVCENEMLLTAVIIVLAFAASAPYAVEGFPGVLLWSCAKVLAVLMAAQLYWLVKDND